jgi:hypothetical protein
MVLNGALRPPSAQSEGDFGCYCTKVMRMQQGGLLAATCFDAACRALAQVVLSWWRLWVERRCHWVKVHALLQQPLQLANIVEPQLHSVLCAVRMASPFGCGVKGSNFFFMCCGQHWWCHSPAYHCLVDDKQV